MPTLIPRAYLHLLKQGKGIAADDGSTHRAADVDEEFRRAYADLFREHRRQEQRLLTLHKSQLQSAEHSCAEAIARHDRRIQSLWAQEHRQKQELERQQPGIRGRLAGLTKLGRAEQQAKRRALAERFENARAKEHYELERQKERQVEIEQADRMTRAREIKRSRLEHLEERQKQARLHQGSHEFKMDVNR